MLKLFVPDGNEFNFCLYIMLKEQMYFFLHRLLLLLYILTYLYTSLYACNTRLLHKLQAICLDCYKPCMFPFSQV